MKGNDMTDIAADDGDPDDGGEQFSVAVFYPDGRYFYGDRWIDAKTAVRRFKQVCESPLARAGVWARIIVTDGGDFTCMEWKHGEGYTYPPELVKHNRPTE